VNFRPLQERNKLFGPINVGDCAGTWRDNGLNPPVDRRYNLLRVAGDADRARNMDNELFFLWDKAKEWLRTVRATGFTRVVEYAMPGVLWVACGPRGRGCVLTSPMSACWPPVCPPLPRAQHHAYSQQHKQTGLSRVFAVKSAGACATLLRCPNLSGAPFALQNSSADFANLNNVRRKLMIFPFGKSSAEVGAHFGYAKRGTENACCRPLTAPWCPMAAPQTTKPRSRRSLSWRRPTLRVLQAWAAPRPATASRG
jgi:hypothetical protein